MSSHILGDIFSISEIIITLTEKYVSRKYIRYFALILKKNAPMPCHMWNKCDSILKSEYKLNNLKVNIHLGEKNFGDMGFSELINEKQDYVKRGLDLLLTVGGGLCLLPFLLIIALLVAIDNKGDVIFAHRRIGQNGKEFKCYKFQTMIPNAKQALEEYLSKNPEARKEWEANFKLVNDPRVTKLGGFLRKTSLDEMPQLWNVIVGDMSLVGPRPIVSKEVERYGENFKEYAMCKPGITGIWQVSGRSDTTYEERVAMDTWYAYNRTNILDLKYLFLTIKVVLFGKGAY